jgi:hypothetical protein
MFFLGIRSFKLHPILILLLLRTVSMICRLLIYFPLRLKLRWPRRHVLRRHPVHIHIERPALILILSFLDRHRWVLIDPINYRPVEHIVIVVSLFMKKVKEDLFEVGVVGFVLEAEGPAVVHVVRELCWEAGADLLDRQGQLLFHNLLIFLLKNLNLEVLPGEGPVGKVDKHVADGL